MKLTLLKQFDTFICHYLGLEHDVAKINRLHSVGSELRVAQTLGFKRHNMKSSWGEFAQQESANLELFGQQIGAALAKNLVISFKDPVIRGKHHA